ncbi:MULTISPECIES: sulfate adenylyltransferase subunit 1 [unclassified Micromonospora]|uniref:sulfate adenylyltransferase subunit 1 n=1 Tax=unclassified Micromonospora TaxID=2617518 RepID=UPI001C5EBD7C|nr:GTP-binding protein [Micromonospora sp. RL09-050-HVF-A]MBW4701817.1 50S ribosome-binding GTPase [Micromonospora sp. RL09-050-HVF-A]
MTTLSLETARDGELLRLATAGSVDDGKSTLVGRLLYDSKSVLADQLEAVESASRARGYGQADLALLTDGLRAEREQGITIDVAYRYFATGNRRFILADTPGHVQYTRNMVTGASTAHLAVILVDARHGVVTQTRRHTAVAALLRTPHVVLAVNKMDLVGFAEDRFAEIDDEFRRLAGSLGVPDVRSIPLSALRGDNVVDASTEMPWYTGPTFLQHLERVDLDEDLTALPARLPVQYVLPDGSLAGQIVAGQLRLGQQVLVVPAGRPAVVTAIHRLGTPIENARAGMSVSVQLDGEGEVGRGDMIVAADRIPTTTRQVTATLCHVAERRLGEGARVLVQHQTRVVGGTVTSIVDRLDLATLEHTPNSDPLAVNDIAGVVLDLDEPIAADPYRLIRGTGSLLLIDPRDGATLSAGLVGPAFR